VILTLEKLVITKLGTNFVKKHIKLGVNFQKKHRIFAPNFLNKQIWNT